MQQLSTSLTQQRYDSQRMMGLDAPQTLRPICIYALPRHVPPRPQSVVRIATDMSALYLACWIWDG